MTMSIYLGQPMPEGAAVAWTTADVSLVDDGYGITLSLPRDKWEGEEWRRGREWPVVASRVTELEAMVREHLDRTRELLATGEQDVTVTAAALAVAVRTSLIELEAAILAGAVNLTAREEGIADFERTLHPTQARELAAALVHYAAELEAGRQ